MSTLISPVTHTAEVAVKDEVINEVKCPLREEIGRHKSTEPVRMMSIKPNMIILSGDSFLILSIRGMWKLTMSDTSGSSNAMNDLIVVLFYQIMTAKSIIFAYFSLILANKWKSRTCITVRLFLSLKMRGTMAILFVGLPRRVEQLYSDGCGSVFWVQLY